MFALSYKTLFNIHRGDDPAGGKNIKQQRIFVEHPKQFKNAYKKTGYHWGF